MMVVEEWDDDDAVEEEALKSSRKVGSCDLGSKAGEPMGIWPTARMPQIPATKQDFFKPKLKWLYDFVLLLCFCHNIIN